MQVKRISQARMAKAHRERETLTPCPSCNGRGFHLTEFGTTYRRKQCKWCVGIGAVPSVVHRMYRRAERITRFMGRAS